MVLLPFYVTTKVPSHYQKTINSTHAMQTKHIDLCYHFIREAVDEGKINVQYIPTAKNVSDIFPKALPRPKFEVFIEKLGLAPVLEEGKCKN